MRTRVFQVLRRVSDDAAGVESVVGAYLGMPRQINMRPDHTVRAQLHVRIDDSIGADLDGCVQDGLWMDDGSGMNHVLKILSAEKI